MTLPDLVDNRTFQPKTLADVLNNLLREAGQPQLSVVTAYFNLDAFKVLQHSLTRVTRLRILLGRQQEQEFVLTKRLSEELSETLRRAGTPTSPLNFPEIRHWIEFLHQSHVEVRFYPHGFLHGKAYLVDGGISVVGNIGIVGSSNFTGAGLTSNLELNAILKQQSAVGQLRDWFEKLWAESQDYKGELLEMLSNFTASYSPYEIYIKVLYEAYRDRFESDLSEQDGKPSPIALTDFQRDGFLAAVEILENYGGVLLADSVGLGKSYLALRLLDEYAYKARQPALIVCPAALRDTLWKPLLQQYSIPHEIVSMEQVSRKDFPINEYARFKVIVVDESHNFRNPEANRWKNLFRLLIEGETDKKLILLTATPVNNSVFDLYHQLRFITKDQPNFFAGIGIPNLPEYFRRAEKEKDALYEVLEAIAVRRSRRFIRENYPNATIDNQPVRFPERRLYSVDYDLEGSYGRELYRRIAEAIENLFLAPYQVDTFRKEIVEAKRIRAEQLSPFHGNEAPLIERLKNLGMSDEASQALGRSVDRQTALAHIMRVLYLKRLESSVEAFHRSLRRQMDFQQKFLEALEKGRLLDSKSYRLWLQIETTDDQAEEGMDLDAILNQLPTLNPNDYDLDTLRNAIQEDIRVLKELVAELEKVGKEHDDKLRKLKELLTSNELRGRKVIVFSYFRDTARYIYCDLSRDEDFLKRLGHRQISIVDSSIDPDERKDRIWRFAPMANRREDIPPEKEIQLLISTDVLSEGQNLQDADTIINYDLHWNPIRMVQRIGRLDRLGSPHEFVHVYNFVPQKELEHLLGLMKRLYEKLDAINQTVGLDESVLGEIPNPMDFNTLRRIYAQNDSQVVDELEAESELDIGESLFQDLLRFLKEAGEEKLQRIPVGVGTGMDGRGRKGFFAAFRNKRTNQHYWLFYDENEKKYVERRLDAIRAIRCDPNEPSVPLPPDFDHSPYVRLLRDYLLTQIRKVQHHPPSLPHPQNKIVNWLYALPPSAERNELLAYFQRPLTQSALRDLKRWWKERRHQVRQDEQLAELMEFMRKHPHPEPSRAPTEVEGVTEEDLECIGWVRVL